MSKKSKVFWAALLTLLVCVGALALAAGRSLSVVGSEETTVPASQAGSALTMTGPSRLMPASDAVTEPNVIPAHGPVHVVRFTLYDAGIYPREVRVDKGLVAITIEDLSGGTSGLVVERVNGNGRVSIGSVQRFERHWRGREELQLQPGSYEVHMADRPNNRALLIVEP